MKRFVVLLLAMAMIVATGAICRHWRTTSTAAASTR
jgi:hypothetical protein